MRRGIVATLALTLAACPEAPGHGDGGTGGSAATGGGTSQGGGAGGGTAGSAAGGTGGSGGAVAGDACTNAIELPAQGGTFTVDTTNALDDYQGGCAYMA